MATMKMLVAMALMLVGGGSVVLAMLAALIPGGMTLALAMLLGGGSVVLAMLAALLPGGMDTALAMLLGGSVTMVVAAVLID